MGLNDEAEKVRYAKQVVANPVAYSADQVEAAHEHLTRDHAVIDDGVQVIYITAEELLARRSAIEQRIGKSWPELRQMAQAACCGSVSCGVWQLEPDLREAIQGLDSIAFLLGEPHGSE